MREEAPTTILFAVTWTLLLMNSIPSFSPPPTKQTNTCSCARTLHTTHIHYPNLLRSSVKCNTSRIVIIYCASEKPEQLNSIARLKKKTVFSNTNLLLHIKWFQRLLCYSRDPRAVLMARTTATSTNRNVIFGSGTDTIELENLQRDLQKNVKTNPNKFPSYFPQYETLFHLWGKSIFMLIKSIFFLYLSSIKIMILSRWLGFD